MGRALLKLVKGARPVRYSPVESVALVREAQARTRVRKVKGTPPELVNHPTGSWPWVLDWARSLSFSALFLFFLYAVFAW